MLAAGAGNLPGLRRWPPGRRLPGTLVSRWHGVRAGPARRGIAGRLVSCPRTHLGWGQVRELLRLTGGHGILIA